MRNRFLSNRKKFCFPVIYLDDIYEYNTIIIIKYCFSTRKEKFSKLYLYFNKKDFECGEKSFPKDIKLYNQLIKNLN